MFKETLSDKFKELDSFNHIYLCQQMGFINLTVLCFYLIVKVRDILQPKMMTSHQVKEKRRKLNQKRKKLKPKQPVLVQIKKSQERKEEQKQKLKLTNLKKKWQTSKSKCHKKHLKRKEKNQFPKLCIHWNLTVQYFHMLNSHLLKTNIYRNFWGPMMKIRTKFPK